MNKTFSMYHNNNIIENNFSDLCYTNILEFLIYAFALHTEMKLKLFELQEYILNILLCFFHVIVKASTAGLFILVQV